MKYVAYTTKGLEAISKKEIENLGSVKIIEVADKRILFETKIDQEKLIQLKTIDDIGIFVSRFEVQHLTNLLHEISRIDFQDLKEKISAFRDTSNTFSITASFAKANIRPKETVVKIAQILREKYDWEFTEFDHTNLDLRIFIDRKLCYISIRLTQESLQHRVYKTVSKAGSLKPTVAAAMVLIATDGNSNLKVVDDFCGSGTILCEAALLNNDVYGGDIDEEAVEITKNNLKNIGYDATEKIKQLNAEKTNWQNHFFDCAISNLPWDKQIEVNSITQLYGNTIQEYSRILKGNCTVCLLVSKPELLIKHSKKYFPSYSATSYKIGLLGQNPTIVLLRST